MIKKWCEEWQGNPDIQDPGHLCKHLQCDIKPLALSFVNGVLPVLGMLIRWMLLQELARLRSRVVWCEVVQKTVGALSLGQLQEGVTCVNVQYAEFSEWCSLSFSQRTSANDTRGIQFPLAGLHVGLDPFNTSASTVTWLMLLKIYMTSSFKTYLSTVII